jgi:hypothetical protein
MLCPAVEGKRPAASLFPLAARRVEAVGADGAAAGGGYTDGGAAVEQRVGLDSSAVIG